MAMRGTQLTIRLLGRFEVLRRGKPIADQDWGRRKTESLLKVLLSEPGRVFSQDQLLEILFEGDSSSQSRNNLFGRVSGLRRVLEPALARGVDSAFIHRKGHGYCFHATDSCWIDTIEFLRLLDEGEDSLRDGRALDAAEALEQVVGLYRGDFLETDPYEEWTLDLRMQWREKHTAALTQLANAYASIGDHHRATLACRTAFEMDLANECVLRQLIRYYQEAGNRSGALQSYDRGVAALQEQLGVEPSAETLALHEAVLEGEPLAIRSSLDRKRIAVLPLVNMSPDPTDEFFADGMAEELIYALSTIRELKVIAQTSSLAYKHARKTAAQIGRELNVGSLIEGSVRKDRDTLRITIQLIDTSTEEHLWANEYEHSLGNVFATQSDIAQSVAHTLQVELLAGTVEQLSREPTANLEAYILYLKGRRFLKTRIFLQEHDIPDVKRAVSCFEMATKADPEYALAWSGLADALCLAWFYRRGSDAIIAQAEEAARRAALLDPHLPEAYASQALVLWVGRQDLRKAERMFRRAIELAPRSAITRRWYGRLLNQSGRRGEALVEVLRAHEIDPLSLENALILSSMYYFRKRCHDARCLVESVLSVDPQSYDALLTLAQIQIAEFDWADAEDTFLKAIRSSPESPYGYLILAEVLATVGREDEAHASLDRGLELAPTPYSPLVLELAGTACIALNSIARGLALFEEERKLAPRIRAPYWWLAMCHWRLRNYGAALEALDQTEAFNTGFHSATTGYVDLCIAWARGSIYAAQGRHARADTQLEMLHSAPEDIMDRSATISWLLFQLGEVEDGLAWMQRSVEEHDRCWRRVWVANMPKHVASDPRFTSILKSTGVSAKAVFPVILRTKPHLEQKQG